MKFFCISDNVDTKTGMRLAGIEGKIVHSNEELANTLKEISGDLAIGIVLITQKLSKTFSETVYEFKSNHKIPLVVTIPDRHGDAKIGETIEEYIRTSVGIKF